MGCWGQSVHPPPQSPLDSPVIPCARADSSILGLEWSGVDIDEFPHLKAWVYKLLERPGFEKGRHVPTEHKAFKMAELPEEELEKLAAGPRAWVQQGMKDDAKK